MERLLHSGVSGPYALALGGEQYRRVVETAEHGGYPLLEHLRKILEGPIVWAPGVHGAVVVSLRGGDFLFESGQDLSIGYLDHDRDVGAAVPGGELQLPRRDARGRGGADRLRRGEDLSPGRSEQLAPAELRVVAEHLRAPWDVEQGVVAADVSATGTPG